MRAAFTTPRKSRAGIIAWSICALSIVVAVARLSLAISDPASSSSATVSQVPGGGVPVAAFEVLVLIALAVIGALVASRQPRNPVGWILCAVPLSLGLLILASHAYWSVALAHPEDPSAGEPIAWVASWIWVPGMVPALTLFPLLFPSGAPPTPRWRPLVWMAATAVPVLFVGQAFTAGLLEDYPVENPLGVDGSLEGLVTGVGWLGFGILLFTTLAAAASLVVRFRRSHGEERQQLKLVTTAAVLFVAIFMTPIEQLIGEDAGFASLLFGLLIIATAVALAILRYRLYDIDVVINRTLVYGALTATLAAVYLGSVLVFQLALEGVTSDSGLAIAASTLAVAALFRPARARIQESVDRRFFRRRYDATRTLESFSSRLRDQVDLQALDAELRGVVSETMQPAHVSVWLRGSASHDG